MKVTLIDYTGKGSGDPWYAANILLFTKNTRLQMHAGLLEEIAAWPEEKKLDELRYMANTIPSSWEFVDLTFLVEGVSRAYTHQAVRTRQASYAQQTMRVLNVEGFDYVTGPSIESNWMAKDMYDLTMRQLNETYKVLIEAGAKIEDARGILPTNICTNIVIKMNLRTFCEVARKRASSRTQDEYRDVLDDMKVHVTAALPWAHLFLERSFDQAAADLEKIIRILGEGGNYSKEMMTDMIKLIDQMRMTA